MKKKITDIWKFITYDIWRITEDEVTSYCAYTRHPIRRGPRIRI